MSWLNTVAKIFDPINELVRTIISGKGDKNKLVGMLATIQKEVAERGMELEKVSIQAGSENARREIESDNWLQKSWRPIIMLFFAVIIGMYWFGFTPENIKEAEVDKVMTIIQFGLSGYVVGRSGEKMFRYYINSKVRSGE